MICLICHKIKIVASRSFQGSEMAVGGSPGYASPVSRWIQDLICSDVDAEVGVEFEACQGVDSGLFLVARKLLEALR